MLSTLISDRPGAKSATTNVLLVQSSAAQSAISIIRSIIQKSQSSKKDVILVRSLYPLHALRGQTSDNVKTIDWTKDVPGFTVDNVDWTARLEVIKNTIDICDSGRSATVVFDSIDTLEDDFESSSKTYKFLAQVLGYLRSKQQPSSLVLHLTIRSSLLPLLQQTSFTPSLVHLSAYPPAVLAYIASEFLAPPPTSTSSPTDAASLKFWSIFIPLTQPPRAAEINALVFGQRDRPPGVQDEIVVEVLTRSHSGELSTMAGASASGAMALGIRRRAVERALEGWNAAKGEPCKLEDLLSLKSVWRRNVDVGQDAPDPTKNLTFNLNLTESQQNSKAKVPLPYEHEGNASSQPKSQTSRILYDPDSADDLDEEDPDEDLDI